MGEVESHLRRTCAQHLWERSRPARAQAVSWAPQAGPPSLRGLGVGPQPLPCVLGEGVRVPAWKGEHASPGCRRPGEGRCGAGIPALGTGCGPRCRVFATALLLPGVWRQACEANPRRPEAERVARARQACLVRHGLHVTRPSLQSI